MASCVLEGHLRAGVIEGKWGYSSSALIGPFRLERRTAPSASVAKQEEGIPSGDALGGTYEGEFHTGTTRVRETDVRLAFTREEAQGDAEVDRWNVSGQGRNRFGAFEIVGTCGPARPSTSKTSGEGGTRAGTADVEQPPMAVSLRKQYLSSAPASNAGDGANGEDGIADGGARRKRRRVEVNYASLDVGFQASIDGFNPLEDARRLTNLLDSKAFPSLEALLAPRGAVHVDGATLTARWLLSRGGGRALREPVLVKSRRGLGMRLPSRGQGQARGDGSAGGGGGRARTSFDVSDVRDTIGGDHRVKPIECATHNDQEGWDLDRWVQYMGAHRSDREHTLNLIDLEFSGTAMAPHVVPPLLVRLLDWVETAWPARLHKCGDVPKVQKYCLSSAAGSWTDFHVDFGGTSVWYHVVSGAKRFLLVPPTAHNLGAFERWAGSVKQSTSFFTDFLPIGLAKAGRASEGLSSSDAAAVAAAAATGVKSVGGAADANASRTVEGDGKCYEYTVRPGQTLIIPTGWIHAVYTPVDSLVVGGNFLHSLQARAQLHLQQQEERIGVKDKFRFPHFVRLQWYAAARIVRALRARSRWLTRRAGRRLLAARGGQGVDDDTVTAADLAMGVDLADDGNIDGGVSGELIVSASDSHFALASRQALVEIDGSNSAAAGGLSLAQALSAWTKSTAEAISKAEAAQAKDGNGNGNDNGGDIDLLVGAGLYRVLASAHEAAFSLHKAQRGSASGGTDGAPAHSSGDAQHPWSHNGEADSALSDAARRQLRSLVAPRALLAELSVRCKHALATVDSDAAKTDAGATARAAALERAVTAAVASVTAEAEADSNADAGARSTDDAAQDTAPVAASEGEPALAPATARAPPPAPAPSLSQYLAANKDTARPHEGTGSGNAPPTEAAAEPRLVTGRAPDSLKLVLRPPTAQDSSPSEQRESTDDISQGGGAQNGTGTAKQVGLKLTFARSDNDSDGASMSVTRVVSAPESSASRASLKMSLPLKINSGRHKQRAGAFVSREALRYYIQARALHRSVTAHNETRLSGAAQPTAGQVTAKAKRPSFTLGSSTAKGSGQGGRKRKREPAATSRHSQGGGAGGTGSKKKQSTRARLGKRFGMIFKHRR